jgi:hypothetical protein
VTVAVLRAESRWDALTTYIRVCADKCGLADWDVQVDSEPSPPGTVATSTFTDGRRVALIRVAQDFWLLDPTDQREAIAHELVHPHFAPLGALVEDDLADHLMPSVYMLHVRHFRRTLEYGVEAVAIAIAKALPLPELPR